MTSLPPSSSGRGRDGTVDIMDLDRFVDGELSVAEQQALLQRIEETGDWRRLALAFVESQVLHAEFSERRSEPAAPTAVTTGLPEAQREHPAINRRRLLARAVLVAGLLLAGFVALNSSGFIGTAQPVPHNMISWTFKPDRSIPQPGPVIAIQPSATPMAAADPAVDRWPASIRMVVSDGRSDLPQIVEVPVGGAASSLDEVLRQPSQIPPDMRRWAESAGHELEESRTIWPVQLPDGRQLIIPVSQVRMKHRPEMIP